MTSMDVDSFSTNATLGETINICLKELFKRNSSIHGLNKKQITEMLSLTTKKSIILFDMVFYTYVDGVARRSSVGSSLAYCFFCHHETK